MLKFHEHVLVAGDARVVSGGVSYTVVATQQGLAMTTDVTDFTGSLSGVLGNNDGNYVNDLNYGLRQPDGTYNTDVYTDDTVRRERIIILKVLLIALGRTFRLAVVFL